MNTWEISVHLFKQPHSLFSVSNPNKCTIHSDTQFILLGSPSVPDPVFGAQIQYVSALTQSLQVIVAGKYI